MSEEKIEFSEEKKKEILEKTGQKIAVADEISKDLLKVIGGHQKIVGAVALLNVVDYLRAKDPEIFALAENVLKAIGRLAEKGLDNE
jgi:hypothetical protein